MADSKALKRRILDAGASLAGFCYLKDLLPDELRQWPFGIAFAVALSPGILQSIRDTGPSIDYFAETLKANDKLVDIAGNIEKAIGAEGFKTCILPSTITHRRQLNRETFSVLFPHKTAATRSGLGWIGKSSLLITKELGPGVRLGTVLTDMELDGAAPVTRSECGECRACVDACPAGAIRGVNWEAGMERHQYFDAFRCYEGARHILRTKVGIDSDTCGICLAMCPRNDLSDKDVRYTLNRPESYVRVGKMYFERSKLTDLPLDQTISLIDTARGLLEKAVALKKDYREARHYLMRVNKERKRIKGETKR